MVKVEPLSVLIIDSDNVRRGMMACSLPAADYSLEFSRSAEDGLDKLRQLRPQIVIIGRDGSSDDLCQRIRSLPAGAGCLLLLMDERYRDEAMGSSEAQAAGADASLPFPFEVALLQQRAQRLRQQQSDPTSTVKLAFARTRPDLPVNAASAEDHVDPDEKQAWDVFRRRVAHLHSELDNLDYYQLLALPPAASGAEIKSAYFGCAMELHPDRFMQLEDQELRDQIYLIFKRMSEAFKVLSNPELKQRYNVGLRAAGQRRSLRFPERSWQEPTTDRLEARTPGGQKHLRFAALAEAEGNLRSARLYLSLALQAEPQNEAIRAQLERLTKELNPGPS